MRIGIDARLAGIENRGLGRYIENLLLNINELDSDNEYFIFLNKNNFQRYTLNSNFKKIRINYRWYSLAEQIIFPFKLKKYKLDIIHYPHFNVPIFSNLKFVLTIHDLTLIHHPNRQASKMPYIIYKIKHLAYKILQRISLNKAQIIITPTRFVKDDIIEHYKINKDKINVTYEGIPSASNQTNGNKYRRLKPFLLYVGAAYPHKNLEKLIRAFNELINEDDRNLRLLLVGKTDYFMNRLKEWSTSNGFDKNLVFTGQLSDNDLCNIYQSAEALVFPSLSEGFGLPGLEAQKNSLPVAASKITCLKEVLGKGAVYFNPFSIEDIKSKINSLLNDSPLRNKLIKYGLENIKRFSWRIMAEQTINIYNNSFYSN